MLDLPVKYREVLILKYYHDMAVADISTVLRIPLNTVKTRLRRGKDSLREKIESAGGA